MTLYARNVLHGTLPFQASLIDAVLTEIPPVGRSVNDIELWDLSAVREALAVKTGIKAEAFWDEGDDDDSLTIYGVPADDFAD